MPMRLEKFPRNRLVNISWAVFFGLWTVFLSGTLASYVGSPGGLQLLRLRRLLENKRSAQLALEGDVERLETESGRLESSKVAQEREIRRVLGYLGADELVFDFASHPASEVKKQSDL